MKNAIQLEEVADYLAIGAQNARLQLTVSQYEIALERARKWQFRTAMAFCISLVLLIWALLS